MRGECYWCGREFAVRIDGMIRRHRAEPDESWWWCRGSDSPPKMTSRAALRATPSEVARDE